MVAPEEEARAALQQVERSRRHVVDEIDMPRWYWWGLALGWVGVGLADDSGSAWLAGAATLAFGAVHASASARVLGGRHRTTQLSVRADVAGRRVPLLIIASLVGLGALTVLGGVLASADGADHPATMASIPVAVLILLGGPRLMAEVRRRAARSSSRS
jgi:hypothetical protein